jgi:hypothetical protein
MSTVHQQIMKAIGAHGLWKARLNTAVEHGSSEYSVATIQQDNQCDFGKWLYGNDLPGDVKRTEHYTRCRQLHSQFHQAASKVLGLALASRKAEAQRAMDVSGEFGTVSANLTKAMMEWDAASK